nr:ribonuclease H-like domain-containing protein [Tanacetum cinerariifolium]
MYKLLFKLGVKIFSKRRRKKKSKLRKSKQLKLNIDSSIISSSLKIDSLLDEFTDELTILKSIPPGINETDCDPEEEFRLIKKTSPAKQPYILRAGEESSQPPQPLIASTEAPQMVLSVKLPILKKGEYILWTMKMEQNKPGIDDLDIDDLYNNLKVYKANIKGSSGSSSNSQKVAFVSAKSTSNTNELNVAYSVSTVTCHSSQALGSSSYADELMFSFFANQSSTPQLDKEALEQIDQDDLEQMDLKWHVAMLSMRVKDCRSARNSRNRSRDARNTGYRGRDNGKRPVKEENENALVVQDGLGTYDWIYQVEEEATEFSLMAFTSNPSNSSSSNSELDEALKEKEDLKAKLEKFETSSKNLTKLLDSQISEKVKTGLGYDSQFNKKEVLDLKEEEVTETVFDNHSSDEENSVVNDRFKKGKGYHTVSPPPNGNYMPPKPDLSFAGLDDSIYKFKISETVTSLAKYEKDALKTSNACVEKPKVDRSSAPLIEDWETDSDDDSVFKPEPINAKIDFVKAGESVNHVESVKQGTGHRESRPVWNDVQRINHQNKFALTAVFTRSGRIPVSAAKPKAATSTSAAKPVNTARPKQSVNFLRTKSTFHKSHSPIRRSFYNATAHSKRNSTERVNTAGSKAVSAIKGNEVTVVKTSAGHLQQALKNKGIVDSGRSRHITRNKAYLVDYQEIHDGGFVTFGSSRGKITGKASIDESNLWHMRLGYVNFKTMNKLMNGNLVRGLPSKSFNNDHCCVACQTGKQYKATCTQDNVDTGKKVSDQHYIVFPLWSSISFTYKSSDDKPADDKPKDDIGSKTVEEPVNKEDQAYRDELDRLIRQEKEASDAADALRKDNPVNVVSTLGTFSIVGPSSLHPYAFIPANTLLHVDQDDSQIHDLEETAKLQKADVNNMESSTIVSHIPTHKMEPKKVSQALDDESWVEEIHNRRLSISWQEINFNTVQEADYIATSTIEAEYVAAANCYGQVKANQEKDKTGSKPDKNGK